MANFVQDFTAHATDVVRIKWEKNIDECIEPVVFSRLIKEIGKKPERRARMAYLTLMDMVKHGSPTNILLCLRHRGQLALQELLRSSNVQRTGWNGFGAGINLFETMLASSPIVRRYILQNWKCFVYSARRNFQIIQKNTCHDPIATALGDRQTMTTKTEEETGTRHKIRSCAKAMNKSLTPYVMQDVTKIEFQHGFGFADWLRRLELIFLNCQGTTENDLMMLHKVNKLIAPDYYPLTNNYNVIMHEKSKFSGPKFDYSNKTDWEDKSNKKLDTNYYGNEVGNMIDYNLSAVLLLPDDVNMNHDNITSSKLSVVSSSKEDIDGHSSFGHENVTYSSKLGMKNGDKIINKLYRMSTESILKSPVSELSHKTITTSDEISVKEQNISKFNKSIMKLKSQSALSTTDSSVDISSNNVPV